MLRVVAHLVAKPDKIAELREMLTGLIGPTRDEWGCIKYELHVNNADPTEFCFIEEWESDTALDTHLASPHLQAAFPRVPELCSAPPDIRRYTLIG
jgi:quinol monooxygenase YgiN